VTFERKDQPEVALIIVLDKSWSMAGAVMELCKAAAQAAIDVLSDEHKVGVVTFNDGLNWDVTVRNVGKNREAIRKAVAAIEPSGHTLIFPAVEQAYLALKDVRARAKHVVLLSDGRSYPDDYEGLVKKMVEAKMTVSSIAVGPAADVELLTNIAKWGKGRSYAVQDAKEVPQIFVKEAKNAVNPSFDEKAVEAGGENARLPGRSGHRARTCAEGPHRCGGEGRRDGAAGDRGRRPAAGVLADWPRAHGGVCVGRQGPLGVGLGPLEGLRDRSSRPVVRAIARQRAAGVGVEVTAGITRGAARPVTVSIEARDLHGNYLDRQKPTVTVRAGDGPYGQSGCAPGRPGAAMKRR
jgi:uncharacterized protein YegL